MLIVYKTCFYYYYFNGPCWQSHIHYCTYMYYRHKRWGADAEKKFRGGFWKKQKLLLLGFFLRYIHFTIVITETITFGRREMYSAHVIMLFRVFLRNNHSLKRYNTAFPPNRLYFRSLCPNGLRLSLVHTSLLSTIYFNTEPFNIIISRGRVLYFYSYCSLAVIFIWLLCRPLTD